MKPSRAAGGLPPIYRTGGRTYHADTCEALRAAVARGEVRLRAAARGTYPGSRLHGDALPGVRSIGFWDAVGEQRWGLDWHRNEGLEICLLESGRTSFRIEDRIRRLRAGDLTCTRPWQKHALGDPCIGPGRLHWLILDVGVHRPNQPWRWPDWIVLSGDDRRELSTRLRHAGEHVWRASATVRGAFQAVARALEAGGRIPITAIAVHVNLLLLGVLAQLRTGRIAEDRDLSSDRSTVALFLEDLRTNPNSLIHPWSVPEMAARCGVSAPTFTRICRRLANTSPADYLLRSRLARAAVLLREAPDTSVLDVAMACGFSSSQYFATAFLRQLGETPSAYRRSARRGTSGGSPGGIRRDHR